MAKNVKKHLIIASLLLASIAGWIQWTVGHFVQPHIKAPPYIAPSGCSAAEYGEGAGKIPCPCADVKYEFSEARKYGFIFLGRRNNAYYRVGNDAVEIVKEPPNECTYRFVVRDTFYQ